MGARHNVSKSVGVSQHQNQYFFIVVQKREWCNPDIVLRRLSSFSPKLLLKLVCRSDDRLYVRKELGVGWWDRESRNSSSTKKDTADGLDER